MYLIHCRAKSSIMCSSCNHVQWTQYVGLHHVAKWPSQEYTLSFKIRLLFCTCSWLREVFSGGWLHELYSTFSSCSIYLWVVSSYEAISFWAQRVLAEERLKGSGRHSRTVISTDWSGVAQAPRLPHYSSRNTLNDKQGANVTLHLRLRSWMWINMKWWLDVDIQFDGGYTKRAGALDLFI